MSKKIVQEYLKKGDKINAKVVFDNGKKFKVEFEGEIKSMSNNNSGGFSNKQLEQLQGLLKPIVERLDQMDQRLDKVDERLDKVDKRLDKVDERLDKVDKRLDLIEKDIKLIKKTPTMQRELDNKN